MTADSYHFVVDTVYNDYADVDQNWSNCTWLNITTSIITASVARIQQQIYMKLSATTPHYYTISKNPGPWFSSITSSKLQQRLNYLGRGTGCRKLKTRNSAATDKPHDAFLQCNGKTDLLETRPSHMCRHAKFCCSALKGVGINAGNSKNCGALELRSLGMGGVADPQDTCPSPTCYYVKFGSSATKGVHINRR